VLDLLFWLLGLEVAVESGDQGAIDTVGCDAVEGSFVCVLAGREERLA